ncbi:MAG TPA: hypothetical protein VGW34_00725 [Allosphingosinicella sp.]|nr:hypothetical protein [Allosphingosinicella sp.]
MGPVTPTKVAGYGLVLAGLALLLAGRVIDALGGSFWAGVALILIALSCLVDALLPGGSELTDEQIVMLRHAGIPYRKGAEKVVSIVFGVALLGGGLYLLLG